MLQQILPMTDMEYYVMCLIDLCSMQKYFIFYFILIFYIFGFFYEAVSVRLLDNQPVPWGYRCFFLAINLN